MDEKPQKKQVLVRGVSPELAAEMERERLRQSFIRGEKLSMNTFMLHLFRSGLRWLRRPKDHSE